MRSYEHNEELARQAGASNFIDATGKYKGKIVRAEAVTSKNGTEGVEFSFESEDGRTANYLQCWTYNAKGEPLYGLKMLNAILTCARVRGIKAEETTIKDRDATRKATIFPSLTDRPIGLLLQREGYIKGNGDTGFKFNIYAPFHAQTELTATEMLDGKTTPEALPKILASLSDKPMQAGRQAPAGGYQQPSENPADAW